MPESTQPSVLQSRRGVLAATVGASAQVMRRRAAQLSIDPLGHRMRFVSVLILLSAIGCGSNANVYSFEAPGNLERTHDLSCVGSQSVSSSFTPADIYPAVVECVSSERFQEAVELYAFAYAYALFDTKRVREKSAHQAIGALQAQTIGQIPRDEAKEFFAYFQQASAPGSASAEHICAELRRVGPPTYEPRYMLQHGVSAVFGEADPDPPSDFDPVVAWSLVLAAQMRCPSS